MNSVHLIFYLMTLWIPGEAAFRGPHHPKDNHHNNHYHPKPNLKKNMIKDKEILHDQRHIAEDLGQSEYFEEEKLSAQEMEFRYFQVHDVDSNLRLDGIEMYHAIQHHLDISDDNVDEESWTEKEKRVVKLIDEVLEEYDEDNDGYINYAEFTAGRRKDSERKDEV